MTSSEELCLQWNDFQNIVRSAFADLRNDEDLTDVTLVFEDGRQIKAHKLVLAAMSPFFLDLLKRNKHPHSAPPNLHERHQIGKHVGYD